MIAKSLSDERLKDKKIFVCENLSLKNERIREFKTSSIQKAQVKDLNVVIILDDE